jgi:hypothetical protein
MKRKFVVHPLPLIDIFTIFVRVADLAVVAMKVNGNVCLAVVIHNERIVLDLGLTVIIR